MLYLLSALRSCRICVFGLPAVTRGLYILNISWDRCWPRDCAICSVVGQQLPADVWRLPSAKTPHLYPVTLPATLFPLEFSHAFCLSPAGAHSHVCPRVVRMSVFGIKSALKSCPSPLGTFMSSSPSSPTWFHLPAPMLSPEANVPGGLISSRSWD